MSINLVPTFSGKAVPNHQKTSLH